MLHNMGGVASPDPGEIGASILELLGTRETGTNPAVSVFPAFSF